jgi:hypothetical protein
MAETREYFVFETLAGGSPMVCWEVCELKISSLNYSTIHIPQSRLVTATPRKDLSAVE